MNGPQVAAGSRAASAGGTGVRAAAPPRQAAPAVAAALPTPALAPQTGLRSAGAVAVVLLVDFERRHRLWAWSRLVMQTTPLRGVAGLRFAKVLGSGAAGGFGVKPSGTHQGLFLGFDDDSSALQFVRGHPLLVAYRQRARALAVLGLRASSSRGAWSGHALQATVSAPSSGPVAVLTRASIKPGKVHAFWSLSPAAEASLAAAPGCSLAMGLGEAPLLRQATFSLWHSTTAMEAYARSGAHLQAIRAAYGGGHFSESMFVRFAPLWGEGHWQGVDLRSEIGAAPADAGFAPAPVFSSGCPHAAASGVNHVG